MMAVWHRQHAKSTAQHSTARPAMARERSRVRKVCNLPAHLAKREKLCTPTTQLYHCTRRQCWAENKPHDIGGYMGRGNTASTAIVAKKKSNVDLPGQRRAW